jgi:hypothetical protein
MHTGFRFFAAAAAIAALLPALPSAARAGNAGLTLQDPAAAATPAPPLPDWMAYQDPYAAQAADIARAHMSDADVALWAQQRLADALSLEAAGLNEKFAGERARFSEKGWGDYGRFLQESRALDAVRGGQNLLTVADGEPRVTASADHPAGHRWSVQIPMMHSLSGGGDGSRRQLTVDIVRVAAPAAATGAASGDDLRIDGLRAAAAP